MLVWDTATHARVLLGHLQERNQVKGTNKHRRCHVNIRKHFFTKRVTEPRSRLSREVAMSPFLEMLQSYLDVVLGNLLEVVLIEQEGGPGGLRGPFLPQPC